MMRSLVYPLLLLLAVAFPAFAADAPVPGPGPQALMERVSQDLLRELEANRAVYAKDPVKLLGDGTVSKKLVVEVNKVSRQAAEKIKAAGGEVKVV